MCATSLWAAISTETATDGVEPTTNGASGMVGYDYTFRRPKYLSVTGAESGLGHAFLNVRTNSIEGGTSEIKRIILGEQELGLPGVPRVVKEGLRVDVTGC